MEYLAHVRMWYELGLIERVYEFIDQTESGCWTIQDSVFEKIGDAEIVCNSFESAFVKIKGKWWKRVYELTDDDMKLTGRYKDYFQYECDKYTV